MFLGVNSSFLSMQLKHYLNKHHYVLAISPFLLRIFLSISSSNYILMSRSTSNLRDPMFKPSCYRLSGARTQDTDWHKAELSLFK
jgi:hypothetical protein